VILRRPLPEPGADNVTGGKVAERPLGNPATEKATLALKPPLTVTIRATLLRFPETTGGATLTVPQTVAASL
jgi:hypothetical protein